jgi:hypothetical protein
MRLIENGSKYPTTSNASHASRRHPRTRVNGLCASHGELEFSEVDLVRRVYGGWDNHTVENWGFSWGVQERLGGVFFSPDPEVDTSDNALLATPGEKVHEQIIDNSLQHRNRLLVQQPPSESSHSPWAKQEG